jgi:thiol:disulfide interchange protein DsbD
MVVGPCVGPLLAGLLLYIATLGSKIQGFFIMWSFAMGMGMLFLVIGTFSGAASSLPKSGEWMVKIKHLFGILMLGFSLYYIKPLLTHNIFLLCLGGLLIGVGIYIGALDPIKDDTKPGKRLWKSIGILCLTLGIAYAARFALGEKLLPQTEQKNIESSGISWYQDEDYALAIAGKKGKPVMIDFTADWCSSCRRLDAKTFSDPEIIRMANNFIPVKVDNSDAKDVKAARLRKKYGVIGLPSVVFLDPKGNMIKEHTITEFIGPAGFLKKMRSVESKFKQSQENGK